MTTRSARVRPSSRQPWGPVSVVINNAGVAHRDKATHLARETLRNLMSINVEGAFMVAQEAARRMIRDGRGGSIINVSSVLSEMPMRQVSAYGASKAAVSQMTRCLALEWAKHGIRVNEIRPGWFETGLTAPFSRGREPRSWPTKIPRDGLARRMILTALCCCSHQKRVPT
jgi:2-deoxy-D-gluconate 3-dehydrogenase